MTKKTKVYYVINENSCFGVEELIGDKALTSYLEDVLNCGDSLDDLTIIVGKQLEANDFDIETQYKVSL